MSVFPISITKSTFRYTGGGSDKEYHTVLITQRGPGLRGLGITRWGKTGTWGQMDFHPGAAAVVAPTIVAKEKEKRRKGYETISTKTVFATNADEFQAVLGAGYYFKLGEHLEFICPGADAKGVKSEAPIEWVEKPGGKFKPKERPPKLVEEEKKSPDQAYVDNPLYGAF